MSYAVIRTGGKQYRVSEGDTLRIEKLEAEVGGDVQFDDITMLKDGDDIVLDRASLSKRKVQGKVIRHGRGVKIHVATFKRRKGSHRHIGHRQSFTEVRISSLS